MHFAGELHEADPVGPLANDLQCFLLNLSLAQPGHVAEPIVEADVVAFEPPVIGGVVALECSSLSAHE